MKNKYRYILIKRYTYINTKFKYYAVLQIMYNVNNKILMNIIIRIST